MRTTGGRDWTTPSYNLLSTINPFSIVFAHRFLIFFTSLELDLVVGPGMFSARVPSHSGMIVKVSSNYKDNHERIPMHKNNCEYRHVKIIEDDIVLYVYD